VFAVILPWLHIIGNPYCRRQLSARGCMPMFLVLKGKEVKAAIEGCNSPQLQIEMAKFLPPRPEGIEEE
jgi:hypothetical protein